MGKLPTGRDYFGFQRTDLQKRPLPNQPDTLGTDEKSLDEAKFQ
jgi:hypothetical protein